MTAEAPQIPTVKVGAVRNGAVNFANELDSGELLTGTPAITEVGTSDLTFANQAVNTAQLSINGATVAIGKAVQFKVSGHKAGKTYRLNVQATTDAAPVQTLIGGVRFKAVN